MKYIKLFEEVVDKKIKIIKSCKDLGLINYKINDDLSVDVDDHVLIENRRFSNLPISFGTIGGDFIIKNCDNLTTLKGCPKIVYCNFALVSNFKLEVIDYLPFLVSGNFDINHGGVKRIDCSPNKIGGDFGIKGLHNLEDIGDFSKTEIGGYFSLTHLFKLISLKGCPSEVESDFILSDCVSIESLEHCPSVIGGDLRIDNTYISSLKGCPNVVKNLNLLGNRNLKTLEFCPEIVNGGFKLYNHSSLTTFRYFPKVVKDGVNFYVDTNINSFSYPKEIAVKLNGMEIEAVFPFIKEMNDYGIWNSDGTFNDGRYKHFKDDLDL